MSEKLEAVEKRYEELNALMAQPEVVADFEQVELPLVVRLRGRGSGRGSVSLKSGTQVTGQVESQWDDLLVTKIDGDWLWVESVDDDEQQHGWIQSRLVK